MTSTSQSPSAAATPTVGGYRLLTRIGEGGMGVVHLAEGPDGRRAALKVLRPNVVGDDESRRRLAQEVASLQHVRSSHVAEVLDSDPWGEVPYVVTRYVPGHSLHALVEQAGPLPPADLEHAARGLLAAVQDVHAAQVLHRDLKPTNVVMEGRSPILIDFGLARLAEDPRLTATGWLMGTPGYLAPEVLFGHPATAATDVHGWAATIVYAATGRSPYGRGHVMTVLDRTRRGDVDLSGVPDRLRPLLARALALEPHERPTVAEAVAELARLRSRPPTLPWPAAAAAPLTVPPTPAPNTTPNPAPATRPYTVLAPARPAATSLPPAPAARPLLEPQLSGWARFRRFLTMVGLLGVVVTAFGTAPYVTTAALGLVVLLARGASHSRQATWQRRAGRGRRWFDGPIAFTTYPWHVLRGAPGSAVLLLFSAATTAAVATATVFADQRTPVVLALGGAALGLSTWAGPGSARVREPLGRAVTGAARHPAAWWVVAVALVLVAGAWWWTGVQEGVSWEPASGAPWDTVRNLEDDLGLDRRP